MQTTHPRRALVAVTALAAALLIGACGDSSGDDEDTPADTGTSPSACAPGGMPSGMGAPGGGGPSGMVPGGGGPSGMAPGGMGPSGGPGGGGPGGDCGGARPSGAGGGSGTETGEFDIELEPTGFIPRGTDLGGYGRRGPVGAHGDVLPAPGE
ncbi:hypothetical protein [Actinoplanes palleronii]|uniref:Uncharacterized protein n=1 Tax=Actinoplanes palleronii TaxID=113570 RepID=A0ABQ4BEX7_9ACTN|nr:hypothetical protein [Actinoplanes palleronii]GIE69209.1 hypothetical protein Apa02nite_053170 [Actinoplanes palleronii]